MKKATFAVLLFLSLLAGWSCSSSGGYGSPYAPGGGYNTPTPNPSVTIAYTISVVNNGSYHYAIGSTALSTPLTITHGQAVVWDGSNAGIHPLNIDNGSTSCSVSGNTSFPVTETFNTTGTFQFHCGNHSSCASGSCPGGCTGMVGTLQVN